MAPTAMPTRRAITSSWETSIRRPVPGPVSGQTAVWTPCFRGSRTPSKPVDEQMRPERIDEPSKMVHGVVAELSDLETARDLIEDLEEHGTPPEAIALLGPDSGDREEGDMPESAAAGGAGGAIVGGVLGSIVPLAIPGIGPVLAAGLGAVFGAGGDA